MSTSATGVMQDAADDWEELPSYPSAVCSGIKGDTNHPNGYHISYNDNSKNDFSTTRPDDKPPNMPSANANDASAIDMSMSSTDMAKSYKNWKRLFDDHSDPRRKYFNAVNCYSGSGEARRLDFVANTNTVASPDHKWHEHCSWRRRYARDQTARKGYVSVGRGDTKQQWEEETMSLTDRQDNMIDATATRVEAFTAKWKNEIPESGWVEDSDEVQPNHLVIKIDAMIAALARIEGVVVTLPVAGVDYELLATMVADKVRSGTITLEFVEEGE